MTGQFGKNHLGDQDKHLPTNHGFDEFFGNLYHLNAEEEPETYYYPKDPEFHEEVRPARRHPVHRRRQDRGHRPADAQAHGNRGRGVPGDAGLDFIDRAHKADKPFFVWMNTTRMHVWTRLKKESQGRTGIGLYPDGMVEHDDHVGLLLDKLDDLGIADNTIVVYSTDNGAETFTWPDGGITPFHGEKGTTWEGGFRVPRVVRWPGVIKPGTKIQRHHLPGRLAADLAGGGRRSRHRREAEEGLRANGKKWKVHLDGYNFLPYFKGEVEKGRASRSSTSARAAS